MFSRKIAGANVWNLELHICMPCHVIERVCVAGSNKRNDHGALYCSKDL